MLFNSGLTSSFLYLDNVDNTLEADESPLHLRSVETHSLWSDAEQIWKKVSP